MNSAGPTTTGFFSWNLVTRKVREPPSFHQKLRQRIGRLEKYLEQFLPDAVHLQIILERHPKKALHTATLTLRLPSNIIRAEKSAHGLWQAFDEDLREMLHELGGSKAEPHRETSGKAATSQEESHEPGATLFTPEPQPEGTGPQNFEDVVHDLFKRHYNALVNHARRDLRYDELADNLPHDAIDPRTIVDEVARQAEADATHKPRQADWLVWFYHLLHVELRRQRNRWKRKQTQEIPTQGPATLPEGRPDALQPMEQFTKKELEPEVARVEDVTPYPYIPPPDQVVEHQELLEHLQNAARRWPRVQREIFELYFIRGFTPEQIAMITGHPLKAVRDHITVVESRFRREIEREDVAA
jgi:RNA polymerase sigma factor (sigma-70 family)